MMHPCLKERFVIILYLILRFYNFQAKDIGFYVYPPWQFVGDMKVLNNYKMLGKC